MKRLFVIAVLIFVTGCEAKKYSMAVTFPDDDARQSAKIFHMVVVKPGTSATCIDLLDGTNIVGTQEFMIEDEISFDVTISHTVHKLTTKGQERRLFYVEASDSSELRILRGCTEIVAGDEKIDHVTVDLVWIKDICTVEIRCRDAHLECSMQDGAVVCGGCISGYHEEDSICDNQFSLTINSSADGSTSPSGVATIEYNVPTSIIATPNSGYGFVNWTILSGTGVSFGNDNDESTTVTLVESDATIQANFGLLITTVAGNGTAGFSDGGGVATAAMLHNPYGVAVDSSDNLYFADLTNNRIRKVDPLGNISTFAGNGGVGYSGDGGLATAAQLRFAAGVAVDSSDNLYIADSSNYCIRKVDKTTGNISTVAGNGTLGYSGDGNSATLAQFKYPSGVAVDSSGNIYIADRDDQRIRKVDKITGNISTFAGNGAAGYSGDDVSATSVKLNSPYGVALDSSDNLYIADLANHRIRKVDKISLNISTVAGNGTPGYWGDGGLAKDAQIQYPIGVAVDSSDNLYISDQNNQRIRKVDKISGKISTVAGNGTPGYSGDGGLATSAMLNYPHGVAVDSLGNIYISDTSNQRIRKVY